MAYRRQLARTAWPASPSADPGNALNSRLLAWWPFQEGQNVTAYDASLNRISATLTGGPTRVQLPSGRAVQFSSSAQSVQATSAKMQFSGNYSFAFWMRANNPSGSQVLVVNGSQFVYRCYMSTTLNYQVSSNGSSDNGYVNFLRGPTANIPAHVCISVNAGFVTLFLNGIPEAAQAVNNPTSPTTTLWMGVNPDGAIPFSGYMWDFRAWSRSITGRDLALIISRPQGGLLVPRLKMMSQPAITTIRRPMFQLI